MGGKPFVHIFDYAVEGAPGPGSRRGAHGWRSPPMSCSGCGTWTPTSSIRATTNISAWHNVSDEAQKRYRQYYWGPIHLSERCNHTKWSVLRIPTTPWPSWPASPPRSMRTSTSGPAWWTYDKMGQAMKPLQDLMAKTDRVRIVSPGTDISFSIRESPASGCTATGTSPTARSTPLP